ncbi:hypothetical protein M433DRAFT_278589, partial [Acidomyces richmondensis BFW]
GLSLTFLSRLLRDRVPRSAPPPRTPRQDGSAPQTGDVDAPVEHPNKKQRLDKGLSLTFLSRLLRDRVPRSTPPPRPPWQDGSAPQTGDVDAPVEHPNKRQKFNWLSEANERRSIEITELNHESSDENDWNQENFGRRFATTKSPYESSDEEN